MAIYKMIIAVIILFLPVSVWALDCVGLAPSNGIQVLEKAVPFSSDTYVLCIDQSGRIRSVYPCTANKQYIDKLNTGNTGCTTLFAGHAYDPATWKPAS